MLTVKEIYRSIQGETSHAGRLCTFVRLAACDLRCSYCDSEYAFAGGRTMSIDEVVAEVMRLGGDLVTVTGGEPLLQPEALPLIAELIDAGSTVLVETSGAHDIGGIDPRAVVIMDLKCPSSGESERNLMANIEQLKPVDEVKFVIATEEDYGWASATLADERLHDRCRVLFSWASPPPESSELRPVPADHHPVTVQWMADKIIADALPVRFLPQIHKVIWGDRAISR